MSKMYIMQGLPGSGKSTKAKEIVERDGNTVRLNRDLLRTMLHFDRWNGHNEGITKSMQIVLAREILEKAKTNVIIDDTNLNPGTLETWKGIAKELNAKVEIVPMLTSIEECIRRDARREKSVGEHVIIGMAMGAGLYPAPEKGIVICDIDGTLADISHRTHFVKNLPPGQKKDWKSFFAAMDKDGVREEIIDKVLAYEDEGYEIFLVSGRPESHRAVTEDWLDKAFKGYKPYKTLFMRKSNDGRADTEVKQGIYDAHFKKYYVYRVIDDRPSVIRMWQSNGLTVEDVGNGEEF